jgi:hypothetical protein
MAFTVMVVDEELPVLSLAKACQEIELEPPLPGYDRTVRILTTVRHQTPELGVRAKFQDVTPVNRRAIESYISGALENQR